MTISEPPFSQKYNRSADIIIKCCLQKTYSLPEKQNAASKHIRASKHIYKNASCLAKSPPQKKVDMTQIITTKIDSKKHTHVKQPQIISSKQPQQLETSHTKTHAHTNQI